MFKVKKKTATKTHKIAWSNYPRKALNPPILTKQRTAVRQRINKVLLDTRTIPHSRSYNHCLPVSLSCWCCCDQTDGAVKLMNPHILTKRLTAGATIPTYLYRLLVGVAVTKLTTQVNSLIHTYWPRDSLLELQSLPTCIAFLLVSLWPNWRRS